MSDLVTIPVRNEGEAYKHQDYPFYSTGLNGEGDVFGSEGEIPAGWTLPNGSKKAGKSAPAAKAPEAPKPVAETTNVQDAPKTAEVDAAGTPLDLKRHTGKKTKAGLWRMKVGVKRPEAESEPKTLDL